MQSSEVDEVTFLIGGEAGQGITRSGSLLGKALMRGGFHIFGTIDYPSIIRGGHNFYALRASEKEIHSQGDLVDLLIALNKETVLLHLHELKPGGGIIYDEEIEFREREIVREDIELYPTPLTGIVKEVEGTPIMRNTVALGAAAALVGLDPAHLKGVISDAFEGRARIIEVNHRVIDMGHGFVEETHATPRWTLQPSKEKNKRIFLTGNEAVALGAIAAGCKFYSAYPMTPASPVFHYLASKDVEAEMVVVQAESEISAITMTVGAAYAGVRAMTATSGGGFCLMTEGFGLAGMTESPIVVMLGQRPGPSTGMATYTAQGDLLFAIHTSQGEFPRVVVAPGDPEESYRCTVEAFNLAERFQVPVIILTDKHLIESHKSTEAFPASVDIDRGEMVDLEEWHDPEEYKRFKLTETGVSPRILLGTRNAMFLANGNEHDEYGFTTIDPELVVKMADKRLMKKTLLAKDIEALKPVRVYGYEEPEVILVGWGSTKGPALDALEVLEERGVKARFVQVVYLEPFPSEALAKAMETGRTILLETNVTAQLGRLVKEHTGLTFDRVHTRYDGRPFSPGEIASVAEGVL